MGVHVVWMGGVDRWMMWVGGCGVGGGRVDHRVDGHWWVGVDGAYVG